jgi:ankyrin repeat protein
MMPADSLKNSFPNPPSAPDVEEFCIAARNGDCEGLNRLLDRHGAAIVNARDNIDARALTWAAYSGELEAVALLLDRGADINAGGTGNKPALGWAAEMGRDETVALLLSRGASLDARDDQGISPRELAARNGHDHIVQRIDDWTEQHVRRAAEEEARRREQEASAATAERLRRLKEAVPLIPALKKNPRPGK